MPKKLIFTLILFISAISVLISVILRVSSQNNKSNVISGANPSPTPQVETSVSFLPNPLVMTSGESASVDVVINPDPQPARNASAPARLDSQSVSGRSVASGPTLVQLEIGYDPNVLFGVNVVPGNYFTNPEVRLEKIDTKNGRVSYALRCDPAFGSEAKLCVNPNEHTLATINFTSSHFGFQKTTKLSFLPKTSLRTNNETVKLQETNEATIILKPSFFAPVATPSGTIINL